MSQRGLSHVLIKPKGAERNFNFTKGVNNCYESFLQWRDDFWFTIQLFIAIVCLLAACKVWIAWTNFWMDPSKNQIWSIDSLWSFIIYLPKIIKYGWIHFSIHPIQTLLWACLFVSLFICEPVYLWAYLFVSLFICEPIYLRAYLFVRLFICDTFIILSHLILQI
jgi:hypothetical protein